MILEIEKIQDKRNNKSYRNGSTRQWPPISLRKSERIKFIRMSDFGIR